MFCSLLFLWASPSFWSRGPLWVDTPFKGPQPCLVFWPLEIQKNWEGVSPEARNSLRTTDANLDIVCLWKKTQFLHFLDCKKLIWTGLSWWPDLVGSRVPEKAWDIGRREDPRRFHRPWTWNGQPQPKDSAGQRQAKGNGQVKNTTEKKSDTLAEQFHVSNASNCLKHFCLGQAFISCG